MSGMIINPNSIIAKKDRFSKAQEYIDKSCITEMEPYVPVAKPSYKNAGKLRESAKVLKPGRITYTAPFAKNDYYADKNHKSSGNPNAQRLWFEVMKKTKGESILRGAGKIIGKK